MVGIECPTCGASKDERCLTKSGWVLGVECHAERRKAAKRAGIVMTALCRSVLEVNDEPREADAKIKLALWYIKTAGGVENARKWLEVAVKSIESIES